MAIYTENLTVPLHQRHGYMTPARAREKFSRKAA